jgi:hypothetical protein
MRIRYSVSGVETALPLDLHHKKLLCDRVFFPLKQKACELRSLLNFSKSLFTSQFNTEIYSGTGYKTPGKKFLIYYIRRYILERTLDWRKRRLGQHKRRKTYQTSPTAIEARTSQQKTESREQWSTLRECFVNTYLRFMFSETSDTTFSTWARF